MLVLPGPGWLTIGLGLVALSAEFIWARRLLNRLSGQAIKLSRSVSGRTGPKESSGSCLGAGKCSTSQRRSLPRMRQRRSVPDARTRHEVYSAFRC